MTYGRTTTNSSGGGRLCLSASPADGHQHSWRAASCVWKDFGGAHLQVVPLDCFKKGQTVKLSAGFIVCREDRETGVFGRGDVVSSEQDVSE